MKIAVFHNVPPGGARRVVLEEVKYLSKRNTVDLYLTSPVHPEVLDMSAFCNRVINTKFKSLNKFPGILNRLVKDCKVFTILKNVHKIIANRINTGGYDVAFIHPDEYLETPYILRYIKLPCVYFCHEPLRIAYDERFRFDKRVIFYKYWYEIFFRYIKKSFDIQNIKNADRILTESKFIRSAIKKYYKRDSQLCYLGVDSNIFKPIAKKVKQLLFIGNKSKLEGYDLAFKIVELVNRSSNFNLKVLDFNDKKTKITDDHKLAREYSRSFLTLCLDFGEPFGLKALESMACGTPVLAVNEGGYKESVLDGITGYLLERDEKCFVQRILFLENNRKVYKNMSKKCLECAKVKWTWEAHGHLLEKQLRGMKYIHK